MIQSNKIETHLINKNIPVKSLSYQENLEIYESMVTINTMEKFFEKEYQRNKIRGFCHLVVGQEALYSILKKILKNDLIISSYRCHGSGYAAGISIKEIVHELLGTKHGNCKGKGGSMHLYNEKFFGGHGIVGAQVPLGSGLAFAIKYKCFQIKKNAVGDNNNDINGKNEKIAKNAVGDNDKNINGKNEKITKNTVGDNNNDINGKNEKIAKNTVGDYGRNSFINCKSDNVVFTIYGDGASNQGQIYETFNMAKVYNLPIVFIVENNKYGMYTPVESVSVDDCFFKRGYAIPGIRVNDVSIDNLYSSILFAKEYAITSGPIILQVDTNRICGHSTLDQDQAYRKESLDSELDSKAILETKIKIEDSQEIKKRVESEFNKIVSEIDYSDTLGSDDLYTDLYYPNNFN